VSVVQFWLQPGEAAVTLGAGEEQPENRIPASWPQFFAVLVWIAWLVPAEGRILEYFTSIFWFLYYLFNEPPCSHPRAASDE
jgi:hypothetical protein